MRLTFLPPCDGSDQISDPTCRRKEEACPPRLNVLLHSFQLHDSKGHKRRIDGHSSKEWS
jgi:hypothetical protein